MQPKANSTRNYRRLFVQASYWRFWCWEIMSAFEISKIRTMEQDGKTIKLQITRTASIASSKGSVKLNAMQVIASTNYWMETSAILLKTELLVRLTNILRLYDYSYDQKR